MSIHFAGSRRPSRSVVARCLAMPIGRVAANDNGAAIADNAVLRAALVHFAAHGLGAASAARHSAETAWLANDEGTYRHWRAVCRMLDRRMAGGIARPCHIDDTIR